MTCQNFYNSYRLNAAIDTCFLQQASTQRVPRMVNKNKKKNFNPVSVIPILFHVCVITAAVVLYVSK